MHRIGIMSALRLAAILEVTVADEDTGAGIPEVDLSQPSAPDGRRERVVVTSWEVATRIAWRESRRTVDSGKIHFLVEPGTHRYCGGLDFYPRDYEAVDAGGQEVVSRAGESIRLEFNERKRC